MIDVQIPTSDGRELLLTRYTQPEPDLKLLLRCLKLDLPEQPLGCPRDEWQSDLTSRRRDLAMQYIEPGIEYCDEHGLELYRIYLLAFRGGVHGVRLLWIAAVLGCAAMICLCATQARTDGSPTRCRCSWMGGPEERALALLPRELGCLPLVHELREPVQNAGVRQGGRLRVRGPQTLRRRAAPRLATPLRLLRRPKVARVRRTANSLRSTSSWRARSTCCGASPCSRRAPTRTEGATVP